MIKATGKEKNQTKTMHYEQFVKVYSLLTKNKMYNDIRINRKNLNLAKSYKRYQKVSNRSLRIEKVRIITAGVLSNSDLKRIWEIMNELVYIKQTKFMTFVSLLPLLRETLSLKHKK